MELEIRIKQEEFDKVGVEISQLNYVFSDKTTLKVYGSINVKKKEKSNDLTFENVIYVPRNFKANRGELDLENGIYIHCTLCDSSGKILNIGKDYSRHTLSFDYDTFEINILNMNKAQSEELSYMEIYPVPVLSGH